VYLVPTSGSPPVALAALLGRPDGDLESEAWGWTRDGAAVVTVRGEPGCAEDYPASGVYLIRDEKPSVLYPVPASKGMTAIAVWAPLLG
jgi:hypothetical protein